MVGVGGSATNDGGAGMARALGADFWDMAGNRLPPGGAALADLARIDWRRPASARWHRVRGRDRRHESAPRRKRRQPRIRPAEGRVREDIETLEAALVRYAAVVRRSLGVDIATLPGGGAAGGLAAGLVAFLGAKIESGFEVVAEASRLLERLAAADCVVTGEGRYDSQSLQGKVTGRIVELAHKAGKRATVIAGSASAGEPGVIALSSLEPTAARRCAMLPHFSRAQHVNGPKLNSASASNSRGSRAGDLSQNEH